MITKGEKLIVWDSTVEDMYTTIAAQDTDDELRLNPLVEICGVVKYPMQRAALFPDRASESAPIPQGTVCRLKLICKGWLSFDGEYEPSLAKARDLMIDDVLTRINRSGKTMQNTTMAAARTEFELLMKHKRGEYAPRTLMGCEAAFVIIRYGVPESNCDHICAYDSGAYCSCPIRQDYAAPERTDCEHGHAGGAVFEIADSGYA